MAQEAAGVSLFRDVGDWFRSNDKASDRREPGKMTANSLTEAGSVNRTFGYKLDQRMNAYTGSPTDFGFPSNTVDQWRTQFTGQDSDFKPANSKAKR